MIMIQLGQIAHHSSQLHCICTSQGALTSANLSLLATLVGRKASAESAESAESADYVVYMKLYTIVGTGSGAQQTPKQL